MARLFVDHGMRLRLAGKLIGECLRRHGGCGVVADYPIERAGADARVTRIDGGTRGILQLANSRSMGLGRQPADPASPVPPRRGDG